MHQQEVLVGVMLLLSTRTNRSSLCLCQGLYSRMKNLDKSSLLIFSIFSSLVGFSSGSTYILYQYISSFRWPSIYHIVFSPVCTDWIFRLWKWNMTFSDMEMKELSRSPWQYSQQNIVDPKISSMSQTSCSRKKPAGERV